jgi:hypothetical protein
MDTNGTRIGRRRWSTNPTTDERIGAPTAAPSKSGCTFPLSTPLSRRNAPRPSGVNFSFPIFQEKGSKQRELHTVLSDPLAIMGIAKSDRARRRNFLSPSLRTMWTRTTIPFQPPHLVLPLVLSYRQRGLAIYARAWHGSAIQTE